jgi:hypothetical protein
MPRKLPRRRIGVASVGDMYCRSIDGMGYCCTSPAMPDKLLCETHVDFSGQLRPIFMQTESPYMRTSGIGTNPMAAAASEAALKLLKDTPVKPFTGFAVAQPAPTQNPMLQGPPALTKLGEQLNASPFFKNVSDHFETDAWVDLLKGSTDVPGNHYAKQLAMYVSDKLGINSENATEYTSDDSNIKVLAAAGVKLMFLICELLARDALWDRAPYLRHVLAQKYAVGSEEHKKAKRALIDALSLFEENEPRVFGDTYSGLFLKAQIALQRTPPKSLGVRPLPQGAIPSMNPKEIVADLLRGMVARAAGLPDPNPDDPLSVAAVMVSNLKAVDAKFKCAQKGVGTITEACWEWIDKQAETVPASGTLAEYAEAARKLMPAFVAVFA